MLYCIKCVEAEQAAEEARTCSVCTAQSAFLEIGEDRYDKQQCDERFERSGANLAIPALSFYGHESSEQHHSGTVCRQLWHVGCIPLVVAKSSRASGLPRRDGIC